MDEDGVGLKGDLVEEEVVETAVGEGEEA